MARKKKAEEKSGGAPEWMATYSDLVTLLFCFFVLLYAMSNPDVQKFQAIASGMSGQPSSVIESNGGNEGILDTLGNSIIDMPVQMTESEKQDYETTQEVKAELNQIASEFSSAFKTYSAENNMAFSDSVDIQVSDEFVRLTFKDGILFDSGRADIKKEALPILDMVADEILKHTDNDIRIEGHTDNVPMKSSQIPSNLYLSAFRAISVAEYLVEKKAIPPEKISTEGMGEFKPIDTNDTVEGRAKNRRVEIKIISKQYSNKDEQ